MANIKRELWRRFEKSGKVEDYLKYVRIGEDVETAEEITDGYGSEGDSPSGSGIQGKRQNTDRPHRKG